MQNKVSACLEKFKTLYDYQFAFRKYHGTSLALIEVTDSIYRHLDNHEKTIGVYLNFQITFDTVNHNILIHKLSINGIRGTVLNWFKNYVSSRKQFILLADAKSDILDITCGVLQGSILGLLFFLIYVNDIQNCSSEAKLKLLADDTNLFVFGKSFSETSTRSNSLLSDLNKWFIANKLCLNIEKTCYSAFSNNSPDCNDLNSIDLKINAAKIKMCGSVKYLKVWIDDRLN